MRGAVQDHPGWEAGFNAARRLARAPGQHWSAWATATHCPVLSPGGQAGAGRQPTGRDPDTAQGGVGRTGDAGMTIYPSHRLRAALGDPAPCLLPSDTSFFPFPSFFSLSPSLVFVHFHFLMLFSPFSFILSTLTNHPHLSSLCHTCPLLPIRARWQNTVSGTGAQQSIRPGSHPPLMLCDPGHVTEPLWVPMSLLIK